IELGLIHPTLGFRYTKNLVVNDVPKMQKKGRAVGRIGPMEIHGHDFGDLLQVLASSEAGIAYGVENDLPALMDFVNGLCANNFGKINYRRGPLRDGQGNQLTILASGGLRSTAYAGKHGTG